MGGILESLERLEPLVALVLLTANPSATCDAMLASISEGEIATVPELFTSQDLVYPALRYAGIIDGVSQPLQSARDQMLRLQTLVALRLGEANSWSTVVTVPPYLRASLPAGEIAETLPVLRQLVIEAQRRLVIVSPFLDSGFVALEPALERFLHAGGTILLITRDLLDPGTDNARVVNALRRRCGSPPNLMTVSWEEEGLGLHIKAVIADSRLAYVGSANLTRGGMGSHAELGVRLEGPAVRGIERLLEILADELRRRRTLRARR